MREESPASVAVAPPAASPWLATILDPAHPWRSKVLAAIGLVALLIIAFVVGTFIHGSDVGEVKASQVRNMNATVPAAQRSNVTLIPVSGSQALPPIEEPITTAPPPVPGQQANDATALPDEEYAAAAARAKADREAREKSITNIDPRSLTGNAYEEPAEKSMASGANEAARPQESVQRTPALPEYKPVPAIHVDHDTTARLTLTVGPDGRVTDIDVVEAIPGQTARLIAAVQQWRFRPATENGTPVTARVSVDITLHANE
jgi:TonB family protein